MLKLRGWFTAMEKRWLLKEGYVVEDFFHVRDSKLVDCDFATLESRVLAHNSFTPCEKSFKILFATDTLTSAQRSYAKAVYFGMVYGTGRLCQERRKTND